MERRFKFITTFLLLISAFGYSQNSVLLSGNWYKVPVEENGVYKLSYEFLRSAGLPVEDLDPRKIKVFGNSGGMLPQANDAHRPFGLIENSILVTGEDDGSFDNGDYVLFYGHGPHSYAYNGATFVYEYNIYSDLNYYFISYEGTDGKRIQNIENKGSNFPVVNTFDDFEHYEIEETNLLISGREWYGERFDLTTEQDFTFDFEGLSSDGEIKVTVDVMTQSFQTSSFDVSINGINVGSQSLASVPDFLNPLSNNPNRYSIKGRTSKKEYAIDANQINSDNAVEIGLSYNKGGTQRSIGYLNFIDVQIKRDLALYSDQTIFRSLQSLESGNSTYNISNASASVQIWNITSKEIPERQLFELTGSTARFGEEGTELNEYVVFDPQTVPAPTSITAIENQDLKGLPSSELLIVAHPDFLSESERLAAFRRSNDGLTVSVVTTDQVFNEFSSGKQDVTAIRDFTKYHYDRYGTVRYLLLFGKGSYDYKNVLSNDKNFVPIYESYNSLDPLDTYASDDYYGFLEDDEGRWEEIRGGNHTMDIGVGRFPVTTGEEARAVVDKAIRYDSDARSLGAWRNEIVFVADDGDVNIHQRQANDLTRFVDTTFSDFNSNKLYLDEFPQVSRPNGQTSPKARKALEDAIEKGALVINFTGHGGEIGWMDEQVLDLFLIDDLQNRNKLSLFVTATCEFTRHDDPKRASGGELTVTSERGGGIAIVSTSRPVRSNSNFALNKEFFNHIFHQENGEFLRLGDIFRLTKNGSVDLATDTRKVGNRNFALLGDPSLRLAYPENSIVITDILENSSLTDTLRALAKTKIKGEVRSPSNAVLSDFNGTLDVTVFDNEILKTTLGNENQPFTFSAKENKLFKGSVSVVNGQFEVNFVVPKNISQQFGEGKISLYASQSSTMADANGAEVSIKIGGTASSPEIDTRPPTIEIYLDDTLSLKNSGISHNTTLFTRLSDESGINISGFGIANSITATLDDDEVFLLNDFYQADKDDFTKGWVAFPIDDLGVGEHTIEVRAADTYNNIQTERFTFFVADPNTILISKLKNSPNPVYAHTSISFNHNRAGDDLEVSLQIISSMGELVRDIDFKVNDSSPMVDLYEWDGSGVNNEKLTQGIYLYRVSVRSLQDGAKGQEFQKLILIK
ncbi:MAG: type IX secretion system sortase PorU [Bacteroidota bacterium]